MTNRPSVVSRLVIAVVIGVVAGVFAWHTHRRLMADGLMPDTIVFWRGARILLGGGDPYPAGALNVAPLGDTDPMAWAISVEPLYYPLPALLLWMPFATVSFLVGSALFTGIGAFLFAFAISRIGLHRLWLCGSVPFITTLYFGQWTTYTVAAALLPALGVFVAAKPNVGLPVVLAWPRKPVLLSIIAIGLLSVALLPHWPLAWLSNVTGPYGVSVPHPIPLLQFSSLGFLLLLALLRWRRQEARFLVAMSCVTQLPFWADQMLLAIIPESRREVIWTVIAGGLGFSAYALFARKVENYVPVMQPYALACTYLPALFIVLQRQNAGRVSASVNRVAERLPGWLRGTDGAAG